MNRERIGAKIYCISERSGTRSDLKDPGIFQRADSGGEGEWGEMLLPSLRRVRFFRALDAYARTTATAARRFSSLRFKGKLTAAGEGGGGGRSSITSM